MTKYQHLHQNHRHQTCAVSCGASLSTSGNKVDGAAPLVGFIVIIVIVVVIVLVIIVIVS